MKTKTTKQLTLQTKILNKLKRKISKIINNKKIWLKITLNYNKK